MKCYLCPRNCGADRDKGERGFCMAPALPVVARAAAHYWEEPCISGTRGSGAVFFSGCNMRCAYCQNREISAFIKGRETDASELRDIFLRLRDTGVHNINLVTPTPYIDTIAAALKDPIGIPVVYNCGGYEKTESLKRLEGLIDIYLPDVKYAHGDYFAHASAAAAEMFRQTGKYVVDGDGIMKRGVIVRHLVLPGQLDNSKDVLEYFAESFERGSVMLSLMSQYTPNGFGGPERRLTGEEYREVVDYMYMLGIRDGYVQEPDSSCGDYVPAFDLTGVLTDEH
ncbi:MAG: radical SAM protein [Oscillospiraceae bacterium]|nr:radical SAM protein [Oscillospiraceae bacterium]